MRPGGSEHVVQQGCLGRVAALLRSALCFRTGRFGHPGKKGWFNTTAVLHMAWEELSQGF